MKIILILGSNMGDKVDVLKEARDANSTRIGKIIRCSSLYCTEPWGFICDDDFINQALMIQSQLSPEEALEEALRIENELGRVRNIKEGRYSSRVIDIDLLFCDQLIIDTPRLQIPHPRLTERRFVLEPLKEIIPDFVHPILHQTISECLENCPDECKVTLL